MSTLNHDASLKPVSLRIAKAIFGRTLVGWSNASEISAKLGSDQITFAMPGGRHIRINLQSRLKPISDIVINAYDKPYFLSIRPNANVIGLKSFDCRTVSSVSQHDTRYITLFIDEGIECLCEQLSALGCQYRRVMRHIIWDQIPTYDPFHVRLDPRSKRKRTDRGPISSKKPKKRIRKNNIVSTSSSSSNWSDVYEDISPRLRRKSEPHISNRSSWRSGRKARSLSPTAAHSSRSRSPVHQGRFERWSSESPIDRQRFFKHTRDRWSSYKLARLHRSNQCSSSARKSRTDLNAQYAKYRKRSLDPVRKLGYSRFRDESFSSDDASWRRSHRSLPDDSEYCSDSESAASFCSDESESETSSSSEFSPKPSRHHRHQLPPLNSKRRQSSTLRQASVQRIGRSSKAITRDSRIGRARAQQYSVQSESISSNKDDHHKPSKFSTRVRRHSCSSNKDKTSSCSSSNSDPESVSYPKSRKSSDGSRVDQRSLADCTGDTRSKKTSDELPDNMSSHSSHQHSPDNRTTAEERGPDTDKYSPATKKDVSGDRSDPLISTADREAIAKQKQNAIVESNKLKTETPSSVKSKSFKSASTTPGSVSCSLTKVKFTSTSTKHVMPPLARKSSTPVPLPSSHSPSSVDESESGAAKSICKPRHGTPECTSSIRSTTNASSTRILKPGMTVYYWAPGRILSQRKQQVGTIAKVP